METQQKKITKSKMRKLQGRKTREAITAIKSMYRNKWSSTGWDPPVEPESFRAASHAILRPVGASSASSSASVRLQSDCLFPQRIVRQVVSMTCLSCMCCIQKLQSYTPAVWTLAGKTGGHRWTRSWGSGPRWRSFGILICTDCMSHWLWGRRLENTQDSKLATQ